MTDFVELFRQWNAGRSQVQINGALGIDRKTVRYAEFGITDVMPYRSLCRVGVLAVRPNR